MVPLISGKLSAFESKFGETFINGVNTLSSAVVGLFSSVASLLMTEEEVSDGGGDDEEVDNSAEEQLEEESVGFWLLSGTVVSDELFKTEDRIEIN